MSYVYALALAIPLGFKENGFGFASFTKFLKYGSKYNYILWTTFWAGDWSFSISIDDKEKFRHYGREGEIKRIKVYSFKDIQNIINQHES